jgi:hypothetical protein
LRIFRDQGVFETQAKVVYCDPGFGMGLAFTEMKHDQRSLLETCLAVLFAPVCDQEARHFAEFLMYGLPVRSSALFLLRSTWC